MNARWYNPGIGRFLTEDTYPGSSLNPQSQNRYAYVMNNPVNMWDPTGHVPSWVGQDYFTWLDNGNYLSEAYILMDYNSYSSGSSLISEVKTAKQITETYRQHVTDVWNYYHLKIYYDITENEETGEKEYNYVGYTDDLINYYQSYDITNVIVKKASEIAAANSGIIRDYGSAPYDIDFPGMDKSKRTANQYQWITTDTKSYKGQVTERVTTTPITNQLIAKMNKLGDTETVSGIKTSITSLQKKYGLPQTGKMNGTVAEQLSNINKLAQQSVKLPVDNDQGTDKGIGNSFIKGFTGFYIGQLDSIKSEWNDLVNDPVGSTIRNTKQNFSDPDTYFSLLGLPPFSTSPVATAKELTSVTYMVMTEDSNGLAEYAGNKVGYLSEQVALSLIVKGISKGASVLEGRVNSEAKIPRSGAEWNEYFKSKYGNGNVEWVTEIKSYDDILNNPKSLWGKSPDQTEKALGEGWTKGAYGSDGTGWKFTNGDKSIFYHPEGGVHEGAYIGVSNGQIGKVKVVGPDYKPLPGDKATIMYK